MTQGKDLRRTTAQKILAIFRDDARVKRAFLRGSLLDGCVDAYSDIDIGIDVSGHDNAAYCQTIIETMSRSFDLHFYDWACSLMPQSYVLTFYIKGLPIFWNVDFECTATPHHGTLTRQAIERDTVAGLFKVWALNAKYILRRVPGIEQQILDFGKRALGVETLDNMGSVEVMATVLDHLRTRTRPRHSEFADACQHVYERQLVHCSD
ncbi:MAG: hypothetical protein SVV80_10330 [Planctomycetota bacterium]|nr:hypothetical protein [Planctomycetota bacterium]